MSSGNVFENLFRQWSSVSKLVVDGKRDPAKVSNALQEVIDEIPNAHNRAKLILGKDFITTEEISQARNLAYNDEQLKMFADTLPSEEDIIWLRDNNYALVAGPPNPMSLIEIRDMKPEYFYTKTGGWYSESKEEFSRNDKVLPAWLGLRKNPVPNSTSKNWDEQNSLLTKVERVPNSAETAWGITTYKAVCKIYLLKSIYVRTSSVPSGGDRVFLGCFDSDGFDVLDNYLDGYRLGGLGLASARIFNPNLNP